VNNFIICLWLGNTDEGLDPTIMREKLDIDAESLESAVDVSGMLISLLKSGTRYRVPQLLKKFIGEDAYSAKKTNTLQDHTKLAYNLCLPYQKGNGSKIMGIDGISIYVNSEGSKSEYNTFKKLIWRIRDGISAGKYLGKLNLSPDVVVQADLGGPSMTQIIPEEQIPANETSALEADTSRHIRHPVVDNVSVSYEIIVQASKKHPVLLEQLFHPHLLEEIEKWDKIEQSIKENEDEDEFEQPTRGTVYFASTVSMPGILKIGGTKRDGPTRVRQLFAAGVPEPYVCELEIITDDWKLYEGAIHKYLCASRLYKRKEFFIMTIEDATRIADQINGKTIRSDEEQNRWDQAIQKKKLSLEQNRKKWASKLAKQIRAEKESATT